jgi:stage V sporulation protein B
MLLLYPMQKESAASAAGCLAILAAGIVFLATVQTLTGVLQGVGKQLLPVRNLFFGAMVKVVVTYILTGIPSVNVRGAALGTVAAYLVAAALNLAAVRKHTKTSIDVGLTFFKPLLSASVMGVAVWVIHRMAVGSMGNSLATLLSITAGVAVYFSMILATKAVTMEEIGMMPKGDRLVRWLEKGKRRR